GRRRRVLGRAPLDASIVQVLGRGILLQRVRVFEHRARLPLRVLDRLGVLFLEGARPALYPLVVGLFAVGDAFIDHLVAHVGSFRFSTAQELPAPAAGQTDAKARARQGARFDRLSLTLPAIPPALGAVRDETDEPKDERSD